MIHTEHLAQHLTAAGVIGTTVGAASGLPATLEDLLFRVLLALPLGFATAAGYALFAWVATKFRKKAA